MLIAVTGCGGNNKFNLSRVTGKVTLDGKPLADALVRFNPREEGSSSQGRTNENGQYVLRHTSGNRGAELGMYSVYISQLRPTDTEQGDIELLPRRYNQQTILTAEVTPGDNQHNFDLKSGE